MYVLEQCRETILTIVVDGLSTSESFDERKVLYDTLDKMLFNQKRQAFGDFSLSTSTLSEQYGGLPAEEITEMIQCSTALPSHIKTEVKGGFVNFFVDKKYLAEKTINDVCQTSNSYGHKLDKKDETIVVEYSSPNYGKELHVGHIRSTVVGDVVSKILSANGYTIVRINYPGDIGGHIGKVITGLTTWYEGKLPDDPAEAIEVMSKAYVSFEQATADNAPENQRKEMLKKAAAVNRAIEDNEEEASTLWEHVCTLSRQAHEITYSKLGVDFDVIQPASSVRSRGKELVDHALEQGVAADYKGAASVVVGKNQYLKIRSSEGTTVYATLDLGAAVSRAEQFHFDKMIYVVGFEQSDYFAKLFKALEKLGYNEAQQCQHLATGHLVLEEGKMSSRQGNVVLLEDVIALAVEHAKEVIQSKEKEKKDVGQDSGELTGEEISRRASIIGIGALKYLILSKDPASSITYNEEQAFNLKGKSAPFAQYAYARASSILERIDLGKLVTQYLKTTTQLAEDCSSTGTLEFSTDVEYDLIRRIADFPVVVKEAGKTLKTQLLTEYIHTLATVFNRFYHETDTVVREEDILTKYARVTLIQTFQQTMKNALSLLGIQVLDKM